MDAECQGLIFEKEKRISQEMQRGVLCIEVNCSSLEEYNKDVGVNSGG